MHNAVTMHDRNLRGHTALCIHCQEFYTRVVGYLHELDCVQFYRIMASSSHADFDFEFEEDDARQAPSSHENLFDFLYKCKQHHRQPEFEKIFSPPLDVERVVALSTGYLEKEHTQFRARTEQGRYIHEGIVYVHNVDVVRGLKKSLKQSTQRHLAKVPADRSIPSFACHIHSTNCALTSEICAFICVLNAHTVEALVAEVPGGHVDLESDADVLIDIDPAQERLVAERTTTESILDYGVFVPDEEEVVFDENKEIVPVPILPTFPFDDKEYVLITDLQNVFNLREDYCLAIIAQNLEAQKDFVDEDVEKYDLIDSAVKDTEYLDAAKTLSMIYEDARRYEETLPSDEEFNAIQIRLGIDKMGRDTTGGSVAVDSKGVDLWNKSTLVDDENQKLFVYEEPFLLRVGGIRSGGMGKDAALSNYLPQLRFPEFLCLHNKFSQPSVQFSIFAIKVLSKFLGGYPVRMNADKIMLLEKQTAVNIFGQGPGMYSMRSRYYLAYAAYGLACGIKEPSQLEDYGKRELLRYGRPRIAAVPAIAETAESSATRERQQIVEGDDTEEPGSKRLRTD